MRDINSENIKDYCHFAEISEGKITCEGIEECPYSEHMKNSWYYDCEVIGG